MLEGLSWADERGSLDQHRELPHVLLDRILAQLTISDRAQAALVCKQWDLVLRSSKSLWRKTILYLDKLDEEAAPELARWLSNRAHGVRELELHFSDPSWWSFIGYLLGIVGSFLTRLDLCAIDCVHDDLHWLGNLTGLTELHLVECLGQFHPSICRLTGLEQLIIHHASDTDASYTIPDEISKLTALTLLELRHGATSLRTSLHQLKALRVLALEGMDMSGRGSYLNASLASLAALERLSLSHSKLGDMPPELAALEQLTKLSLRGCFSGREWGSSTWDSKLQWLSCLTQLEELDLSDNNLATIPCLVASLPCLTKLKVALNPLTDGLPDGPYPALEQLDLHGSSISELPESLRGAQQLTFLGLSCCHSLELDRPLIEKVLGNLQSLESLTLCGAMLESVDSARAMLTLGRMLPRLEVHNQEEVEDGDEEGNHHHDVADPHGNLYTSDEDSNVDSEEEDSEDESTSEEDGSDSEDSEHDSEEGYSDSDSDASTVNLYWPPLAHA